AAHAAPTRLRPRGAFTYSKLRSLNGHDAAADALAAHRVAQARAPPSTMIDCPVIHAPARLARNTAAPAMSSGSPRRRSGVPDDARRSPSGVSQRALANSVLTRPGAIQLTRTLC